MLRAREAKLTFNHKWRSTGSLMPTAAKPNESPQEWICSLVGLSLGAVGAPDGTTAQPQTRAAAFIQVMPIGPLQA